MSADEALFLGAPVAHIATFRERQRIERINRAGREALMRSTGIRGRGGVVVWS